MSDWKPPKGDKRVDAWTPPTGDRLADEDPQTPPTDPFAQAPPQEQGGLTQGPSGSVDAYGDGLYQTSAAASPSALADGSSASSSRPSVTELPDLAPGERRIADSYFTGPTEGTQAMTPKLQQQQQARFADVKAPDPEDMRKEQLKSAMLSGVSQDMPFSTLQATSKEVPTLLPNGPATVKVDPREMHMSQAYHDWMKVAEPEKIADMERRMLPGDKWQQGVSDADQMDWRLGMLDHQGKAFQAFVEKAGGFDNLSPAGQKEVNDGIAYINAQMKEVPKQYPEAWSKAVEDRAAQATKDFVYDFAKANPWLPGSAAIVAKEQVARPFVGTFAAFGGSLLKMKNYIENDPEGYKEVQQSLDHMMGSKGLYGGATKTRGSVFGEGGIDYEKVLPRLSEQMANLAIFAGAGTAGKAPLLATSFTMSHEQYFDEGLKAGMKVDEAGKMAAFGGAAQAGLELISPLEFGATKREFQQIMSRSIKDIAAGKATKEALEPVAKYIAKNIAAENTQEYSQDAADVATKSGTNLLLGRQAMDDSYSLDQFMETGFLTTVTTGIFSGVQGRQMSPLYHESVLWAVNNPEQFTSGLQGDANLTPEQKATATERIDTYRKVLKGLPDGPMTSQRMRVADLAVEADLIQQQKREAKVDPLVASVAGDPFTVREEANKAAMKEALGVKDTPAKTVEWTGDDVKASEAKEEPVALPKAKEEQPTEKKSDGPRGEQGKPVRDSGANEATNEGGRAIATGVVQGGDSGTAKAAPASSNSRAEVSRRPGDGEVAAEDVSQAPPAEAPATGVPPTTGEGKKRFAAIDAAMEIAPNSKTPEDAKRSDSKVREAPPANELRQGVSGDEPKGLNASASARPAEAVASEVQSKPFDAGRPTPYQTKNKKFTVTHDPDTGEATVKAAKPLKDTWTRLPDGLKAIERRRALNTQAKAQARAILEYEQETGAKVAPRVNKLRDLKRTNDSILKDAGNSPVESLGPMGLALRWLGSENKINSESSIPDPASSNTAKHLGWTAARKEGRKSTQEKAASWALDDKEGVSLEKAAHGIWENLPEGDDGSKPFDTGEIRDALATALNTYTNKTAAIKALEDHTYVGDEIADMEAEWMEAQKEDYEPEADEVVREFERFTPEEQQSIFEEYDRTQGQIDSRNEEAQRVDRPTGSQDVNVRGQEAQSGEGGGGERQVHEDAGASQDAKSSKGELVQEQRNSTPLGDRKTITVNGKERPTTNSNGKPIHPTVEGVENFWRWFSPSPRQLLDGLSVSEVSGLKRDAKALADFIESQSSLPEPDRFRVIPTSVLAHVAGVVNNPKILDAIIRSLPVDVVDFLGRKKLSPKEVLNNPSVLKDVFAIDPASDVSLRVNPSGIAEAAIRVVANAGAEITGMTDASFKRNAAVLADASDSVLGAHVRKHTQKNLGIIVGFGDSKVVDAEGRPLVMYHGTNQDFSAFDKESIGSRFDYSFGFHLTNRPEEAGIYADSIDNAASKWKPSRFSKPVKEGASVMAVYVRAETPLDIKTNRISASMEADANKGEIVSRLVEARRNGNPHDSVIIETERKDEWFGNNIIVFDPTQIKSATGNSGAFDSANPNITAQRGEAPQVPLTGVAHIDSVTKALSNLAPDLKVTVHKNGKDFNAALNGRGDANSAAFYDRDAGEIHINLPRAKDNTLFHEAAHVVLAAAVDNNPVMLHELFKQLEGTPEFEKYKKFGALYGDKPISTQMEEAVAEYMADIGSGKARTSALPKSLYQKLKQWIKDMLAKLGFGKDIKLDPANLRKFAEDFAKAMTEGIKVRGEKVKQGERTSLQHDADRLVDGWYSRLDDAVVNKGNTQSGADWSKWMEARAKDGSLSAEEVKWTGLGDWLAGKGKEKVTPKEVRAFLKDNRVKVEVKELEGKRKYRSDAEIQELKAQAEIDGEWGDYYAALRDRDEGRYTSEGAKFSQYQLPGGTRYREVSVVLVGPEIYRVPPAHSMGKEADVNRILHLRVTDRTDTDSKKVLFVEEMQGDWGQQGKRKGFVSKEGEAELSRLSKEANSLNDKAQVISDSIESKQGLLEPIQRKVLRGMGFTSYMQILNAGPRSAELKEEYRKAIDGNAEYSRIKDQISVLRESQSKVSAEYTNVLSEQTKIKSKFHPAPFVTDTNSWVELGLKQAIRMAVEGGYDRIAWTHGQVHTDRWGTERIEWAKQKDGSFLVNAKSQHGGNAAGVDLEGEANARNLNPQNSESVSSREELEVAIRPSLTEGQDAKKLSEKLWARMEAESSGVSMPRKEGFEGFYDKILPNVAKKVSKKLGGDGVVGEVGIDTDKKRWEISPPSTTTSGKWMVKNALDPTSKGLHFDTEAEARIALKGKVRSTSQQSITITPEMRAKAGMGVPLMQLNPEKVAAAMRAEGFDAKAAKDYLEGENIPEEDKKAILAIMDGPKEPQVETPPVPPRLKGKIEKFTPDQVAKELHDHGFSPNLAKHLLSNNKVDPKFIKAVTDKIEERGPVPIPRPEATAKESAAKFQEVMDKQRKDAKAAITPLSKRIRNAWIKGFEDPTGLATSALRKQGGSEVADFRNLAFGAGGTAKAIFEKAREEVHHGLDTKEKDKLDDMIEGRRIINIDKRYDGILQDRLKHPGGLNKEIVESALAEMKAKDPEEFDKLSKRADAYFETMRNILGDLTEAGLVSKELHDELSGDEYSPRTFIHHMVEQETALNVGRKDGTQEALKGLAGGSEESLFHRSDWLMATYISSAYKRIAMNKANQELLSFAKEKPDNGIATVVEPNKDGSFPEPAKGTIRIGAYVDGKLEAMDMDRALGESWQGSDPLINHTAANIIRVTSGGSLFRLFTTGINPAFALTNPARDIGHVMLFTNNYSPVLPVAMAQMARDLGTVAKDAITRGPRWQNAVREGVSMDFLSNQGNPFEGAGLAAKGRVRDRVERGYEKAFAALNYINETSEIFTRLAVRERATNNGIKEFKEKNGRDPNAKEIKRIQELATAKAREYMDFGQGGKASKAIDTAVPYINAQFQGLRVMSRYTKNNPKVFAFKMAQYVAIAALAAAWNYGLFGDDEEKKKKRAEEWDKVPDYVKENNVVVMTNLEKTNSDGTKGQYYIKFPKTQDARIYATFIEGMMEWAMRGKAPTKRSVQSFEQNTPFSMQNLTNVPLITAYNAYLNGYDNFRDDYVVDPKSNVEPWMQRRPDTPAFFKDIGEGAATIDDKGNKVGGMSPEKARLAVEKYAGLSKSNPFSIVLDGAYDQTKSLLSPEERAKSDKAMVKQLEALGGSFSHRYLGVTSDKGDQEALDRYNSADETRRAVVSEMVKERLAEYREAKDPKSRSEVSKQAEQEFKKNMTKAEFSRARKAYQLGQKHSDVPYFYISLYYANNNDIKAKALFDKWQSSPKEEHEAILKNARKVGVLTDDVKEKFNKLKAVADTEDAVNRTKAKE